MAHLAKDLAYALRTLRTAPVFSLAAIVTIALGIGASTAIFSVVSAVLLRPLPYEDPDRLVVVETDMLARDVLDFPVAPADFHDLRQVGTRFSDVAAIVTFPQPLVREDGESEMVRTAGVTPNVFRTLGVGVVHGRDFTGADATPQPQPPEDAPADAPPPAQLPVSAVLSHGFWLREFGGDPGVVGRTLQVGGQSTEVVGVLEPGVEILLPASAGIERSPDVYAAMRFDYANGSRINVFLRVFGRLAPGATPAQAQAQVDALVADLRQRFPIKETAGVRWRVESMHEELVADARPWVLSLMGAVVFVLLIACANVANLLLVRGSSRERELAVRAALGGGRGALLRQLLTESVVLAGAGAALGLLLARGGIDVLLALGPQDLPRLETVALDAPVLAFAALSAVAAALLFGTWPALRTSRVELADSLRSGLRSTGSGGGRRFRDGVVVAEVALAFVLLVGSGLMVRSFVTLQRAEPGYQAEGVLTFFLPNLNRPEAEDRAAFTRQLRDRLGALPGVTHVSAAGPLPLDGQLANVRWGKEEALTDPNLFRQANLHVVLPGYFEAMRTTLLAGRTFTEADNVEGLNQIVIDAVMAERAFPGQDPVGQRLLARVNAPEPEWFEVIGVVAHQRHETLARDGREAVYLPDGFFGHGATWRWIVRTTGDPAALTQPVRAALRELDRSVAVTEMQPMQAFLDRARAPTRFALTLLGVFAGVAVVLSAVGLYGVLATMVRQRTGEIGVRLCFGAERGGITRMVVGRGLRLCGVGLVLGVVAAGGLTRVMTSMLVGVTPTDPLTFAAMVGVFLAVAGVACWLPARQAARLDPTEALRAG